jgi:hypothetical protein
MDKERGEASVKIELSNGIITVIHGTDNVVLKQWTANSGDWDRIWNTINKLAENSL